MPFFIRLTRRVEIGGRHMVFNALTTDEVESAVHRIVDSLGSPQGSSGEAQLGQLRSALSIERYLRVERELHQPLVVRMRDQLAKILDGAGTSEGHDWARRIDNVADSAQLGVVTAELLVELRIRGTEGALLSQIHGVLREAADRENAMMAQAPR